MPGVSVRCDMCDRSFEECQVQFTEKRVVYLLPCGHIFGTKVNYKGYT